MAEQPPQQTLQQLIEKSAKEFKKALPTHMRPERLVRIGLTCIRQNPELAQCTPASFVGALLVSAQLGLEPIAGRAYILPFFNSKTGRKDAQFLVGYKGLAELFYRHEKSVQLAWGVVRKNDEFDYEYGTQAKLRHKPAMKDRGEIFGFYVIAEVHGGAKPFMYMSQEDCLAHGKKHSKTYDAKNQQFYSSSPWAKDPEAMCLKTVLIQLAKLLPLSMELQKAISADETSREYREGIDDAMDIPAQSWENGEASTPTMPLITQETPAVATITPKLEELLEEPQETLPMPLSVDKALEISEQGAKIPAVEGILSDFKVNTVTKKDKSKADITEYVISSTDNTAWMTIFKWGKLHGDLKIGDMLVFEDVKVNQFKGEVKYQAMAVSLKE